MELPGGMDELLRSPDYSAKPEFTAGFGSYLYVLRQLWPGELRPTGRLRYALRAASRRTLYTGIALLCARRQWRPQGLSSQDDRNGTWRPQGSPLLYSNGHLGSRGGAC